MTRSIAVVFPEWMADHGRLGEEHAFSVFERVVRSFMSVSPLLEVESLGTVVIAARGPSRYFGGDVAVAQNLHELCAQANAHSPWGVGVADSRFAAIAAAHLSRSRGVPCVIDSSIGPEFLDGLPVAALSRVGGISADTVDLLGRLGLGTCAAVRGLGEAALIDRFGVEGKRVHQLVTGGEVRHLAPGAPPSDFARGIEFENPLTVAAHVVSMARSTIDDLFQSIAGSGQQCVRLLISCETDHAESSNRIWGEPRGFSEVAIAQRLSCQIEGWLTGESDDVDAPSTGILRVVFEPLECREVLAMQPLLWGGHQENIERAARAASMAMAAGDDVQVCVPRWEGGRDVAAVYSRLPISLVDLSDTDASEQRVGTGEGVARDWSGAVPRPSPSSIATRPRIVRLLDEHERDVIVTGRHELSATPTHVEVNGRTHKVSRIAGPWPIEERWWDPRRRRRQVRMQVLVQHHDGQSAVFLIGLENQNWTLLARYD